MEETENNTKDSINEDNDTTPFISKISRAGGPVTCVSLTPIPQGRRQQTTRKRQHPDSSSSSSFYFTGQGPYVSRYEYYSDSSTTRPEQRQEKHPQHLLVFEDGGTVHGIHFIEHDNSSNNDNDDDGQKINNHYWDSLVYGGKKLAFCNLLANDENQKINLVNILSPTTTQQEQEYISCLTMNDWIWNIRQLETKNTNNNGSLTRIVVGYARHMLEIWNIQSSYNEDSTVFVTPSCQRRIYINPPTMVTSMDLFCYNDQLWIASGTSYHNIWVSSISVEDAVKEQKTDKSDDSISHIRNSICLKGHAGVVHSVKFSMNGKVLASTSDDRSVRLWEWHDKSQTYLEKWVGWGHSARVWGVSFASDDDSLLVSVSEDGTARVWSGQSGETLSCIHQGASNCSLRTIDTLGNTLLMGATDGIIGMYNILNYIEGTKLQTLECPVPDDRPPKETSSKIDISRHEEESDCVNVEKKKKKKTKNKTVAQVIVGMKWWFDFSSQSPRLVVTTRQGSLQSLDLASQEWMDHGGWWDSSLSDEYGIQAKDGCCMAIRETLSPIAAIGTSRGYLILVSNFQDIEKKRKLVLDGCRLKAVQGLVWLDDSTLVSFHVRSLVMWRFHESDNLENSMQLISSLTLNNNTNGVPMSCAYNSESDQMVVGDSRGDLTLFSVPTKNDFDSIDTVSMISHVHQKEHVTSVHWIDKQTILSSGNDGFLHISYLHGGSLTKGWSFSSPSMSGVTEIMTRQTKRGEVSMLQILAAGYYGNTFRLVDIDSGYESIRIDTGGRQRILAFQLGTIEHSLEMPSAQYNLALCIGKKDGSNSVFLQSLFRLNESITEPLGEATGVKLHSETIFGSTSFSLTNREVTFLLTASEDCTSKISAWKEGQIINSIPLTPQESCVRCVASSQFDNTSVLLVVGGGKLILQFFLVQIRPGHTCDSVEHLKISYLGRGLTGKKGDASIDHRINSIKVIPLDENDRIHFVIACDSNGNSHIFLIPEESHGDNRNRFGILIPTTARPILSVEALLINHRILVLVGTTGGSVNIFEVPGTVSLLQSIWDDLRNYWTSLGQYQGHQMGANCIVAHLVSEENGDSNKAAAVISIESGGDDQAICTSRIIVASVGDGNDSLSLTSEPRVHIFPELSYSAIKEISYVIMNGKRYLLVVGYSQTLSLWSLDYDIDGKIAAQLISRVPVDLGDVNSMTVCESSTSASPKEFWVAVCGMGVEMFQLRQNREIL